MTTRIDPWQAVIEGEMADWQACVDQARKVLNSPFVSNRDLRNVILSLEMAIAHGEHIDQVRAVGEVPLG